MNKVKGYVSLAELEQCLIDYYQGTLDQVPDEFLNRLWLPLEQLLPGRPLSSQLDSKTMALALSRLDSEHRLILRSYYGREIEAQVQLESFTNTLGRFELLGESIEALAEQVFKLL